MLGCPNCAGNLLFDIETQKLKCTHCDALIEPHAYEGEKAAEESKVYGAMRYTCTQCGAEILTTDEAVAGFCSYCGSTAHFEGRMSEEKRPDYIIPFSQTKEACRKAYKKRLRRALYAPRALKDPDLLDTFTGIYMPYWVYEFDLNEAIGLSGTERYRDGDYIVDGRYRLMANVDTNYSLPYDASSHFHDSVSETIAPFEIRKMQPFSPVFLSGFHADAADVDAETYLQDAKNQVGEHAYRKFVESSEFSDLSPEHPLGRTTMDRIFGTDKVTAKRAFFPVWFMTWRNRNRVAYAVMNAQTGKLSADIPVSVKRFLFLSLLTALPLFFLFEKMMTPTPAFTLGVTSILALGFLFVRQLLLKRMLVHNDPDTDVGVRAARFEKEGGKAGDKPVKSHFVPPAMSKAELNRGDSVAYEWVGTVLMPVIIGALLLMFFLYRTGGSGSYSGGRGGYNAMHTPTNGGNGAVTLFALFIMAAALVMFGLACGACVSYHRIRPLLEGIPAHAAAVFAGAILLIRPVSDLPYYFATALALTGGLISVAGLVRMYNLLVTRPVPRLFERKGGEA